MKIVQLAIATITALRSALDGQKSNVPTADTTTSSPRPPAKRQREYNPNRLDILDFTPHLGDDEPHTVLPDYIVHQRVDMVANYTNGLRTFTCYNGGSSIRYAHSIGLYTVAGAWIDTRTDKAQKEMDCIISLAKEGVVDLASIGSEALTWGGLTAEQIVAYVELFRMEVPDVPVTTAVLVHTYSRLY